MTVTADAAGAALLDRAEAIAAAAYAPYSRYHVGAAVETASGAIFVAANVENASYGLSLCAEANAIAASVVAGERRIVRVAVVGYPADRTRSSLATPCGRCRQLIREFAAPDATILVRDPFAGETLVATLAELLPFSFGPEAL